MVEPGSEGAPVALRLDSRLIDVDPRLARRRTGWKNKGPEAHAVLADSLGIRTVADLLHHYPRRWIDRSSVTEIRRLKIGQAATVIARVHSVQSRRTRRRHLSMVTVKIGDGTGFLDLVFFNQPWAAKIYRESMELAVSGVVLLYGRRLQLQQQDVEILAGDDRDLVHSRRITPIHPATEGIYTRTIRELVYRALEQIGEIPDPLPEGAIASEGLISRDQAIRWIHFPQDDRQLDLAIERLKFDELFVLELGVAFRKHRLQTEKKGIEHEAAGELTDRLLETLAFDPTPAQVRAMREVGRAMAEPHPMNVLLQGDVGSGKTLVAVYACLAAIQSGHQAAIMAPTEVLAGQHERSVESLLGGAGAVPYLSINSSRSRDAGQPSLLDGLEDPGVDESDRPPVAYALLTAAVTGSDRARILSGVKRGDVDLVIGTHALVQEAVSFNDLSLAVIDEQHRFGLHQRMALRGKGDGDIDQLIMTATPIPRTLAMTYYGDLDAVVIDEMPAGRKPIQTRAVRSAQERTRSEDLVRAEVRAGRQAFVVCAAIDEANKTQVRAAEAEAERLAREVFPDLRVDLLHGRMRPKEKQAVMERFRTGGSDILISTTVIEVGVDVPNATVMLVENAERFGLAQLHQLRGRIGRGDHESYCVLFDESDPGNGIARQRIDAMVETSDGFELADEDLRLRGEGTLFDTKQSGLPDLRLARLAEDFDLVRRARNRAFETIRADPELAHSAELAAELRSRFEGSIDWLFTS
jgi:ATP-dependent DNA helicase RecG